MTFWFEADEPGAATQAEAPSAGCLLGWGVFTTLGIWNGRPFALERHLERLRRDAARALVPLDQSDSDIAQSLHTAIGESGLREGAARLTVTRCGDGRWNPVEGSTLSIALSPMSAEARLAPVRLQLSPWRTEARRPLAGVKSTSYLDFLLAWRAAQDAGFDDALLCNSSGALCEASRANIFWTRAETLYTPSDETGCLPGIGRALVQQWAAESGMPIRTGAFLPHELQQAGEVFVTSSTTGPRPVSLLEMEQGRELRWEVTGPVTGRMQQKWAEAVAG